MKARRALPEQYRLARNLDEGYEVVRDCRKHGEEWLRITLALHIDGPVQMSTFDVEPMGGPLDCLDDNKVTVRPNTDLFSRRPAAPAVPS